MILSADQTVPPAARQPVRRWWRRPWIVPLAIITLAFLAYAVPPYLTFDPGQARLAPLPPSPLFYPLLVLHIVLGSIVLLTACLQVWPWLRRTHPRVHRWSGRIYVGCLLPAAVAVIIIAPMTRFGPNQQVANTTLGVLWLLVTLAGYRAVRERRLGDHRRWMVRSVALSFSIVTNRFWSAVCVLVFAPETVDTTSTPALDQAVGVSSWLSWLVNLAIAEWWLQRRPRRRRVGVRSGSPDAELVA
jgi:uncharacterized membrane protein